MDWAYSSVAERIHGMDEVGVRFSIGPQQIDYLYKKWYK